MESKREILVVRGEAVVERQPELMQELGALASKYELRVESLAHFEFLKRQNAQMFKEVVAGKTEWTRGVVYPTSEHEDSTCEVVDIDGLRAYYHHEYGVAMPPWANGILTDLNRTIARRVESGSLTLEQPHQFISKHQPPQLNRANTSLEAIDTVINNYDIEHFYNIGPKRAEILRRFHSAYQEATVGTELDS